MKRETVRRLGGFALVAVLATALVQPVMAEEAAPEVQNTEAAVQTADQENAADMQRAERKNPSVTVDSVEWNWKEGDLKIPVDSGDYSENGFDIFYPTEEGTKWILRYNDGYISIPRIQIINYNSTAELMKEDPWYTKAGNYEMEIGFGIYGQDADVMDKVTIHVLEDSEMWQMQEEVKSFDGSQDVTFSFKNGTNLFEIQSVKWVGLYTGKAAAWEPSVSIPNMTEGFTCDVEAGTFTINKDALDKALRATKSNNGGVMPDQIEIAPYTVSPYGDDYCFAVLPDKLEDGSAWGKIAWKIDVSKWKAAQNEKPNETPNESEMSFGDVAADHWYYDYVKYVYDRGLMTGLNENDFGPAQSLARAQFAVILYRMEGEPEVEYTDEFPDVVADQWYTDAIMWASRAGIVTGYTDSGLFGTGDDINREQMAVMMHRYAEYKGFDVSKKADFGAFSDAASVNEFADEAMQWAVGTEIISGKDEGTRIDPQGDAARAECATIIQRFVTTYGM